MSKIANGNVWSVKIANFSKKTPSLSPLRLSSIPSPVPRAAQPWVEVEDTGRFLAVGGAQPSQLHRPAPLQFPAPLRSSASTYSGRPPTPSLPPPHTADGSPVESCGAAAAGEFDADYHCLVRGFRRCDICKSCQHRRICGVHGCLCSPWLVGLAWSRTRNTHRLFSSWGF